MCSHPQEGRSVPLEKAGRTLYVGVTSDPLQMVMWLLTNQPPAWHHSRGRVRPREGALGPPTSGGGGSLGTGSEPGDPGAGRRFPELGALCPAAQAFSGDHRGQLLSSMFRSAFQKSRRWRGWAGGGGISDEVAAALTQAGHGAGT